MKKRLLLAGPGVCAGALVMAGFTFIPKAQAVPIEYVRVCTTQAGYFYSPGTDSCATASGLPYIAKTDYGTVTNALGPGTDVYGVNALAVGNASLAIGDNATSGTAPQNNTQIKESAAVFVDPGPAFTNNNTTAVGNGAMAGSMGAGEDNATAVGQAANASGLSSTAIGQGSAASATNASAFGQGSVAAGESAIAIGAQSGASGQDSSAVGFGSMATGNGASAFGQGSMATANSATAIGTGAQATFAGGTAIGAGAMATADPATAVGDAAVASGNNSSAFGASATASGTNAVAIGQGSVAQQDNSIAVGTGVKTTRANQVAIGTANQTYTLAGVVSQQSRAAQTGATQFVTTDGAGNLATSGYGPGDMASLDGRVTGLETDVAKLRRNVRTAYQGTAIALAVGGAVLPAGKSYAVSGNIGTFQGETAFGGSAVVRLTDNVFASGGIGVGLTDHATVGGRAGVTFAW